MKIYQIEISNYCNLSCVYCPHVNQVRQKGLMSLATYMKVIKLTVRLNQKMLFLHNFGEPLLNSLIYEFILVAKNNGIECSFFTNGVSVTDKELKQLANVGLRQIFVSNHVCGTREHIQTAIEQNNLDIKVGGEWNDSVVFHDWAGQVQIDRRKGQEHFRNDVPCVFERQNAFVILWNGDIASCCIDCEGKSVEHNIDDLLNGFPYKYKEFSLCGKCDLMRGEETL